MPPTFLGAHNPAVHGPFAPVCLALEQLGGLRCRATDANGTYHAYRMPDASILGESLVTPSPAKVAADAAAVAAASTEATRQALILQRLGERASLHETGKTATVTNIAQAQGHIREMHRTLEGLCRFLRQEILQDL